MKASLSIAYLWAVSYAIANVMQSSNARYETNIHPKNTYENKNDSNENKNKESYSNDKEYVPPTKFVGYKSEAGKQEGPDYESSHSYTSNGHESDKSDIGYLGTRGFKDDTSADKDKPEEKVKKTSKQPVGNKAAKIQSGDQKKDRAKCKKNKDSDNKTSQLKKSKTKPENQNREFSPQMRGNSPGNIPYPGIQTANGYAQNPYYPNIDTSGFYPNNNGNFGLSPLYQNYPNPYGSSSYQFYPNQMVPNTMPSTGMIPNTMVPTGMVPNTMGPTGMVPNTMVPTGMVPNTIATSGVAPNQVNPNTINQNSMSSNPTNPSSMSPNGVSQNDSNPNSMLDFKKNKIRRSLSSGQFGPGFQNQAGSNNNFKPDSGNTWYLSGAQENNLNPQGINSTPINNDENNLRNTLLYILGFGSRSSIAPNFNQGPYPNGQSGGNTGSLGGFPIGPYNQNFGGNGNSPNSQNGPWFPSSQPPYGQNYPNGPGSPGPNQNQVNTNNGKNPIPQANMPINGNHRQGYSDSGKGENPSNTSGQMPSENTSGGFPANNNLGFYMPTNTNLPSYSVPNGISNNGSPGSNYPNQGNFNPAPAAQIFTNPGTPGQGLPGNFNPVQGSPNSGPPPQGFPGNYNPGQGNPSSVPPNQGLPSNLNPAQGFPSNFNPGQGYANSVPSTQSFPNNGPFGFGLPSLCPSGNCNPNSLNNLGLPSFPNNVSPSVLMPGISSGNQNNLVGYRDNKFPSPPGREEGNKSIKDFWNMVMRISGNNYPGSNIPQGIVNNFSPNNIAPNWNNNPSGLPGNGGNPTDQNNLYTLIMQMMNSITMPGNNSSNPNQQTGNFNPSGILPDGIIPNLLGFPLIPPGLSQTPSGGQQYPPVQFIPQSGGVVPPYSGSSRQYSDNSPQNLFAPQDPSLFPSSNGNQLPYIPQIPFGGINPPFGGAQPPF
ncbi:hypothetical protein AYI70_g10607, partial [Smittium culicis]